MGSYWQPSQLSTEQMSWHDYVAKSVEAAIPRKAYTTCNSLRRFLGPHTALLTGADSVGVS